MYKISVIMPVYNEKPDYLKSAIESILNQTYKDFEFIIIDDASDSYVSDIINSYKDDRINYQRQDSNQKICAALNKGISLSCGEFIAIMHSDDTALPNRLGLESKVLEEYPKVGLVNSFSLIKRYEEYFINAPITDNHLEKIYLKYIGNNIVHPNVMLRKKILDDYSLYYDDKFVFAEDYRMWTKMCDLCNFYTIPEVLTIYNVNINPNRQNIDYMNKCKKVILLENYIKELDLNKEEYSSYIDKIWSNEGIRYMDYLTIKAELLNPILNMLEKTIPKKFFFLYKNRLIRTIEDFSPIKSK